MIRPQDAFQTLSVVALQEGLDLLEGSTKDRLFYSDFDQALLSMFDVEDYLHFGEDSHCVFDSVGRDGLQVGYDSFV